MAGAGKRFDLAFLDQMEHNSFNINYQILLLMVFSKAGTQIQKLACLDTCRYLQGATKSQHLRTGSQTLPGICGRDCLQQPQHPPPHPTTRRTLFFFLQLRTTL